MTSTGLPTLDQPTIDTIFARLLRMEVELDENPLEYGPRRLNQKTAQARGFLTDLESLSLKVSSWLQKYKAAARAAETALELGKKHLLANDPEVRGGRNVADRDALASVKLKDEVEALSEIQGAQTDLESILTVIKTKRADLRDVQGRLRDQMRLCQEEIALGGRWGSKPPPGKRTPDLDAAPKVDKKSLRDLQDMFAGINIDDDAAAELVHPVEDEDVSPDELLEEFGRDDAPLEVLSPEPEPEPENPNVAADAAETIDDLLGLVLGGDTTPPTKPQEEEGASSIADLLGIESSRENDAVADSLLDGVSIDPPQTKKKALDIDALLGSFDS